MIMIWFKFIICAGIIFFAGKRVAKYGDIIAEKTGLGGLWIGLVLVAVATSLPEIFTGVGSVVFVDAPDLTFGNLFGANTYNLLNLVLLDFLYRGSPLLSNVSSGQLLTGALSLLPLLIASSGIFLSQGFPGLCLANISLFSSLILIIYLISVRIIFKFEQRQQKILKELKKETEEVFKYGHISQSEAFAFFGFFASIIIGAGIWLAYLGEGLAGVLGWEKSFIGSLFLGFTTTLPEITVSVAALRLGAKEMAVANMLGSNLFNMTIIFINDLLYRKAPIFLAVSSNHIFTSLVIIFMTVIVISAMILKPKKKMFLNLSGYAWGLIAIFIIGAYVNFVLGTR